jgi:hypothetical protein
MTTRHLLVCVLALCAPLSIGLGQEAVSNPAKRQTTVDLATRLLGPQERPAAALPADLVDPFNPPGFGAQSTTTTTTTTGGKLGETTRGVSSDREILQKIATQIRPSGMLMFGGQPLLLFREKKLKVGDSLTITCEGTDYVVVISGIDQTSFKIRLNGEEITRPIKSGKVP